MVNPVAAAANDRWVAPIRHALPTLALILVILAGSWSCLIHLAAGMRDMRYGLGMWLMPRMTDWGTSDLVLVFLMWALMMAAMMLPSVTATVARWASTPTVGGTAGAVGFITGYLLVWVAFSLVATLLQWLLLRAALVSPMMESTSALMSAALFLVAGLYQFTPLKRRNLCRCRSSSITATGRPHCGAIAAGVRSGAACLACCWALMLLLFATGVMNVTAMIVLAAYVLAEKSAAGGLRLSRVAGAVLCAAGVALLV